RVVLIHSGLGEPASYDTTGVGAENAALSLAGIVPRPDVVIVGHTHREVRDYVVNGVHFVQPKNGALSLAVVQVWLTREPGTGDRGPGAYRVTSVRADLLPLTSTPELPRFTRRFAAAHERVRTWAATPLGSAGPGFSGRFARAEDTPLLDFINEVQRRRAGADLSAAADFDLDAGLPEGGGGYTMLQGAPVVYDRGESIRDLLAQEIGKVGTITAPPYYTPSWSILPPAREAVHLAFAPAAPPVSQRDSTVLRVLAINDFHGALEARIWPWSDGRPVGGAAALKPWLDSLARACGCTTVRLDGGAPRAAPGPRGRRLRDRRGARGGVLRRRSGARPRAGGRLSRRDCGHRARPRFRHGGPDRERAYALTRQHRGARDPDRPGALERRRHRGRGLRARARHGAPGARAHRDALRRPGPARRGARRHTASLPAGHRDGHRPLRGAHQDRAAPRWRGVRPRAPHRRRAAQHDQDGR